MEKTMRRFKVRAFGITRELLGGRELFVETKGETVGALKEDLLRLCPELAGLRSFFIAVNNTYAEDNVSLQEGDEIALIPPVSGG
jgi:sulfur-carrier protein